MRTVSLRLDSRGNLVLLDGMESVQARVAQRLRLWLGEWFANTLRGVPYRSEMFTQPVSIPTIVTILVEQIRSVTGVTNVTNPEAIYDFKERVLSFTCTVHTEFGTTGLDSTLTSATTVVNFQ